MRRGVFLNGVVGALLTSATGLAFAQKWVAVAESHDKRVLVDVTSFEQSGTGYIAWTKTVFIKGSPPIINGQPASFFLNHLQCDCASKSTRSVRTVVYDRNGNSLGSVGAGAFEETVPGTSGEIVRALVCEVAPTKVVLDKANSMK
jgi:hypothetical protein